MRISKTSDNADVMFQIQPFLSAEKKIVVHYFVGKPRMINQWRSVMSSLDLPMTKPK